MVTPCHATAKTISYRLGKARETGVSETSTTLKWVLYSLIKESPDPDEIIQPYILCKNEIII